MSDTLTDYLKNITRAVGEGWNRFWFTPCDPYPLGVIRVLAGLMALYIVGCYTPDLVRFFGPDGMLPVPVVKQITEGLFRFSFLDYCQTPGALYTAHAISLAVLVLFTIGFKSRITSILALVVVLSYIERAQFITWQIEAVLSFVMFYLCLGPSGRSWSVDRWLQKSEARQPPVATFGNGADKPQWSWGANVAIRLLQIHLAAIYLISAFSKVHDPAGVWWNGTAVYWLLIKPESALIDLRFLHDYYMIINLWTHAIVVYELAFPVFIWNRLARPLMLVAGVLIWASIAVATGLVAWSVMMLAASLAFVPAATLRSIFRDRLASPETTPAEKPAVATPAREKSVVGSS